MGRKAFPRAASSGARTGVARRAHELAELLRDPAGGERAAVFGEEHESQAVAVVVAAPLVSLIGGAVGWGWKAQQRLTAQLLGAPDAIKSSVPMGVEVGTVVVSKQRGQAIILMDHVPEAPAGKVYEAWTISGKPVAAGTFTADDAPLVHLPSAALTADKIAVTVEPEGGVTTPTSDPVFALSLT